MKYGGTPLLLAVTADSGDGIVVKLKLAVTADRGDAARVLEEEEEEEGPTAEVEVAACAGEEPNVEVDAAETAIEETLCAAEAAETAGTGGETESSGT